MNIYKDMYDSNHTAFGEVMGISDGGHPIEICGRFGDISAGEILLKVGWKNLLVRLLMAAKHFSECSHYLWFQPCYASSQDLIS